MGIRKMKNCEAHNNVDDDSVMRWDFFLLNHVASYTDHLVVVGIVKFRMTATFKNTITLYHASCPLTDHTQLNWGMVPNVSLEDSNVWSKMQKLSKLTDGQTFVLTATKNKQVTVYRKTIAIFSALLVCPRYD